MGAKFQTHPIMNIKRNIIFALESRKKNGVLITENVPIRMRVIFASQRIEFTTGYRIDATKWDADKQRVKNGCTNKLKQSASEINADLLQYYYEIQNIFKECEIQNIIPTREYIKKTFIAKLKNAPEASKEKADQLNFLKAFDEFIAEGSRTWAEATIKKFTTAKKHITTFNVNPTFEDWTETHLNNYVDFLLDNDLRNVSVNKEIKCLKWFLRWAFKKNYHHTIAFATFKPKLKSIPKKVIFLTWDELTQLREYKIPESKEYLDRVRDVFLFCCFTGLRYSDVRNLKQSDIKENHIEITTIKTADNLIIEQNKFSKAILDKYKNSNFKNYSALPVISNEKMNEYLKELGELAELKEPVRMTYYKGNERIDEIIPKYRVLSTHAGRRTFICNALALGIPAQVVMKWTGHSDYKAMKPYIDIADDIKAKAMDKFNQL